MVGRATVATASMSASRPTKLVSRSRRLPVDAAATGAVRRGRGGSRVGSCASTRPSSVAQRRTRFETQFVHQAITRLAVDPERLGLPPAAIQREHPQLPQPLAQRMLRAQRLELTDDLAVLPQLQSALVSALPPPPAPVRRAEHARHRRTPRTRTLRAVRRDEAERIVECRRRGAPDRLVELPAALRDEVLEPHDVDVIGRKRQRVAGIRRDDRARSERPPQVGDRAPAGHLTGFPRRLVTPQGVDQPIRHSMGSPWWSASSASERALFAAAD